MHAWRAYLPACLATGSQEVVGFVIYTVAYLLAPSLSRSLAPRNMTCRDLSPLLRSRAPRHNIHREKICCSVVFVFLSLLGRVYTTVSHFFSREVGQFVRPSVLPSVYPSTKTLSCVPSLSISLFSLRQRDEDLSVL